MTRICTSHRRNLPCDFRDGSEGIQRLQEHQAGESSRSYDRSGTHLHDARRSLNHRDITSSRCGRLSGGGDSQQKVRKNRRRCQRETRSRDGQTDCFRKKLFVREFIRGQKETYTINITEQAHFYETSSLSFHHPYFRY